MATVPASAPPKPKDRDWIDLISKLLLPVVLAVGGGIYTLQKDKADKATLENQRTADRERQQLDRDTGYIKLLTSTNDRERNLGLQIIEVLEKEHKFSPDMVPIVQAVANGRPGDSNTQRAQDVLTSFAKQNPSAETSASVTPQSTPVEDKAVTAVYIQIGSEEQKHDAEQLQAELKQLGYPSPGIESVINGTTHTYVRYFSHGNRGKADTINEAMRKLGFLSEVQDFSNGRQLPQLEIWIGVNEKAQLQPQP